MARPQKQTADYFPHYAVHGKTLFIIESQYGVEGYAFWFKLLELLCITPGHCYFANTVEEMAFLTAKTGLRDRETTLSLLETLAMLGAIDKDLWEQGRAIWSQNLVDNLAMMYKKRKDAVVPDKPLVTLETELIPTETPFTAPEIHKVNKIKVKEIIVDRNDNSDGDYNYDFLNYINILQGRYPTLNIKDLWIDCCRWYQDQSKTMKNAKMALNNWCKKELEIHPPSGNDKRPQPLAGQQERLRENERMRIMREIRQEWDQQSIQYNQEQVRKEANKRLFQSIENNGTITQ